MDWTSENPTRGSARFAKKNSKTILEVAACMSESTAAWIVRGGKSRLESRPKRLGQNQICSRT
jgi:hypothetical protein